MIKFYQYPNCTTCKKAAKFLQEYGVSYEPIDIVQHTPTKKEFKEIIDATGIDINKLFNTHGAKYRELGLKDKLKDLSDEEKLDLLSSNGMLVKRPLAVLGNKATVGFKEDQYKTTWI
ncbi:arsenate reductase family protein [Staphylococcus nepalensis]|jgi:arsenate reductase|uniref:arsenate reductase family protein n=1 Tax=Staphylococcus TaxID=1279 RepID=UPI000E680B59|nr:MULTISPECIES: arsenate reductase family protein [Staphylococcus]MCD8890692.1 arsenate reductase family protein [Staphylococcus nepalensis]MCY1037498.1 arsenate reductase family protein [Staphylococcus nepalensis]MDR5648864.1 arsenate reductase family protein [Staphylococcus nepalensis]MDW8553506.1 arsenate reductase family protein [Staphylococcus nepalensis]RIO42226.1 arsenate reductase family protein [Staphylococcus nepalensis]